MIPLNSIQNTEEKVLRVENERPVAPSARTYDTPEGRYHLPDPAILQELREFDRFYKPPGRYEPKTLCERGPSALRARTPPLP